MKSFIKIFIAFWTTLYVGMVIGRWSTLYMQIARSPIGRYMTSQEINQKVLEHEVEFVISELMFH